MKISNATSLTRWNTRCGPADLKEFQVFIFTYLRQTRAMKFTRLFWLTVLATMALASCGVFKKPEPKTESKDEPKSEAPKLVGRIASVPADKRFVLIQSYDHWNIETDTILTTRGPMERTANLRVTGESLGQFAAADLQSGTVEVGDAVYSIHVPMPAKPTSETPASVELPEDQQKSKPENVQKNN
jgi:hypothetical protein